MSGGITKNRILVQRFGRSCALYPPLEVLDKGVPLQDLLKTMGSSRIACLMG